MDLNRYQRLLKEVETLRSQADRADGKLQQLKQQLKEEFGVDTIKQAKAKFKELDAEYEKAKAEFEEATEQFEKEFGDKL